MKSKRSLYLLGVHALALSAIGCASWFMNGAETQTSPPQQYRAHFRASDCLMLKTRERIEGAKADYYLATDERGPVLYEFESETSGAAIRNAWADATGQHFFAWVTSSHGFQFTFPREPGLPPERLVFAKDTYSVKTERGTQRPVGQPAAACTLELVEAR